MIARNSDPANHPDNSQASWNNEGVAEVSLLMPAWQAAELVDRAGSRRLTVGQLLRGLVRTYVTQAGPESLSSGLE